MAGWRVTECCLDLPDLAATQALGKRLAAGCGEGLIVYLAGNLGAGKTTLARAIIAGLGYEGRVRSPTYTLVEPYRVAARTIYHFDLYRLADPEELEFLGIRDYLEPGVIWLVEWPERGEGMLPPADVGVVLEHVPDGRRAQIDARTAAGSRLLRCLQD